MRMISPGGGGGGGASGISVPALKHFTPTNGQTEFDFGTGVVGPFTFFRNGVAYFEEDGHFTTSGEDNSTWTWNETVSSGGALTTTDAVTLSAFRSHQDYTPAFPYEKFKLKVTTPTVATATVTAELLALTDSAGNSIRVTNFSASGDMSVSGNGGLDVGAEAADTTYYIWALHDGSENSSVVFSASSSSPTTNFSYKRLVGEVRNDSGSDFIQFIRDDNRVAFYEIQDFISATAPPDAYTEVSLPSSVPLGCTSLGVRLGCTVASRFILVKMAWDASGNGEHPIHNGAGDAGSVSSSLYNSTVIDFAHDGGNSIHWVRHANTSIPSNTTTVGIKNYTLVR